MTTTKYFKKKQPFDKYEYGGELYVADPLNIEVFGDNHKHVADALYRVLNESRFLVKYPCFTIKVATMDSYKPIINKFK